MYTYFINHLSPNQHGFVPGRSTVTNLLCYSEFVHEALKNALQVDTFYTNLSKAFDKVNFWILISRLSELGLPEALLALLESYLLNRKNKDRLLYRTM